MAFFLVFWDQISEVPGLPKRWRHPCSWLGLGGYQLPIWGHLASVPAQLVNEELC